MHHTDLLLFIIGWYLHFCACAFAFLTVLAQVECLSIVDGSVARERTVSDITLPRTSENKRAVRFQNDPSHPQKIPFDLESVFDGRTEILSRFFGMWRFKSRQQLRMQMVRWSDHDV